MDILVGAITAVSMPDLAARGEAHGTVEGTVLAVRPPRGSRHGGEGDKKPPEDRRRRRSTTRVDPPGARVLTLLITDPAGIPVDAGTAPYRVLVRFIKEA